MRGTFINSSVDLLLETEGEAWPQGDRIKGSITANKSSSDTVQVILAYGILKKVRAKESKAWTIIDSVKCSSKGRENWEFNLSTNCMITDKAGGLFLLYGEGDNLAEYGFLQLTIGAHPVVKEFLSVFEMFFRFQVKQMKGDKKFIKIKMAPPISNEYKSIDSLDCKIRFEHNLLHVDYLFKIKKLVANEVGDMDIIKEKKEISQELKASEYHCFGGSTNFDVIQEKIQVVIKEAVPNFFK